MAAFCSFASAAPLGSQQTFGSSPRHQPGSFFEIAADPDLNGAYFDALQPWVPGLFPQAILEQPLAPPAEPILAPAIFSSITLLAFSGVFVVTWHRLRNLPGRRRRVKYVLRTMASL